MTGRPSLLRTAAATTCLYSIQGAADIHKRKAPAATRGLYRFHPRPGQHPGRIHSEAALDSLCGVSPIPASSRKDQPTSAEPGRRPPSQCGSLSHRSGKPSLRLPHQTIPELPHRRRTKQEQDHPQQSAALLDICMSIIAGDTDIWVNHVKYHRYDKVHTLRKF